ncbi:Urocanase [Carpediemonas membranifera]|uniref:urocanate hydratase n=1 Tax=Carpediemonas membranifera TaxID=201153 RepID=A0A8J6E1H3_9EUKA|nr:Urocanase [Carpediemonas membranifera]|eukprot:KAG9396354.1 Urocanase [Carpediemonas membranifera]
MILDILTNGIPTELPEHPGIDNSVPHAPKRFVKLSADERKLAIANALRYFDKKLHSELAKEFAKELDDYGHIYMYRFRPTAYPMRAHAISEYPGKCEQAKAIMLMIMNNLDKAVAQFPHELITYGGNGSVFSNWGQYLLTMRYLCTMTNQQTLAMYSGHPHGLFPSHPDAPRVVVTNGMVIPNYSTPADYDKGYALGVTQYGQMTAGSFMYIGPQGIVHGTTLTVLNAFRRYHQVEGTAGRLFVTAGLGGMSGAQPKAGVITGCVTVVAEVDRRALLKRKNQGWVMESSSNLDELMDMIRKACAAKKPMSIAYEGNVVDLWERLGEEDDIKVDLGSDQTSLHNPYQGGYYPAGMSFDEANKLMVESPEQFKEKVHESLVRHVNAVNKLTAKGMAFFDYGNCFLHQASVAGANIKDATTHSGFKYPSYVQDVMGFIFGLGFGPFRWVCTSNDPADLKLTDKIAADAIVTLMNADDCPKPTYGQYKDNLTWVTQAGENKLVVGSQARILYSDDLGRRHIAKEFNAAVRDGRLKGPIVLGRDHHDVSGTDSPFRETSNIYDGSQTCADMAIQNVIGDSFRGATWTSIHNGGGTGWGLAMNGGFGLMLDGSDDADRRADQMLQWDVCNGVARRAWARDDNADLAIRRAQLKASGMEVTMAQRVDESVLADL